MISQSGWRQKRYRRVTRDRISVSQKRPAIEQLEARIVLATFAVDQAADVVAADGLTSLREAIDLANVGAGDDLITLPDGIFAISRTGSGEDINSTGDFDITDTSGGLTIEGQGPHLTIIDGAAIDRLFDVRPNASLTIRDVTLRHGALTGADMGGAINNTSALILKNVVLEGNSSQGSGGAVANMDGTVSISNSTFDSNFTPNSGGGVYSTGPSSNLNLEASTFVRNLASDGAGIWSSGSTQVSASTFSGNAAADSGGAIVADGQVDLTSSTITENSAIISAGGVQVTSFGALNIGRTILAGNSAPVGPDGENDGVLTSLDANLIGANDEFGLVAEPNDLVGTAVSPLDPLLGPLADHGGPVHTHSILDGSPTIDVITGLPLDEMDQRGITRSIGGAADIGAFEWVDTSNHDSASTNEEMSIAVDVLSNDGLPRSSAGNFADSLGTWTATHTGSHVDIQMSTTDFLPTAVQIESGGEAVTATMGIVIPSVRNNFSGGTSNFRILSAYPDASTNEIWVGGFAVGSAAQNAATDFSATYFPFNKGWTGGLFDSLGVLESGNGLTASDVVKLADGRYEVTIPTAVSSDDGILFPISAEANGNIVSASPSTENTWEVQVRNNTGDYNIRQDGAVSFVYIPWDDPFLQSAGHVDGDSVVTNSLFRSAGMFDITREAEGEWRLTIPGHSPDTGMLLLTATDSPAGLPADDNFMSYEADGTDFIIHSHDISGAVLQDGNFIFSFVSFEQPTPHIVSVDSTLAAGEVSVASGVISIDPVGRYDVLEAGQDRNETLYYTVQDDFGAIETANVAITISGENDAPTGVADEVTTSADATVIIPVLDNDFDVDEKPFAVAATFDVDGEGQWVTTGFGEKPFEIGVTGDEFGSALLSANDTPIGRNDGVALATINENTSVEPSTIEIYQDAVSQQLRLGITQVGSGGTASSAPVATTYFPFADGWIGGHFDQNGMLLDGNGLNSGDVQHTATGRYRIAIPGVTNSEFEGSLFVIGGADSDNIVSASPLGGNEWQIAIRNSSQNYNDGQDSAFSLVYVPWSTPELIGGRIDGGGGASVQSFGDFSVLRETTGRWKLTIPGHSPQSGVLLMTTTDAFSGDSNDDNFLSYEADGSDFIIESRDLPGASAQDSDFNFVYIPYGQKSLQLAGLDVDETVGMVSQNGDELEYSPTSSFDSLHSANHRSIPLPTQLRTP